MTHPDDMNPDMSPRGILARELRHSEASVKRWEERIQEARAEIAEIEVGTARAVEHQERLRAALDRLGSDALTTAAGEPITA